MNVAVSKPRGAGPPPIGDDLRPVVALPSSGLPGIVIAGGGAVLAVLLFLFLDGQRQQDASDNAWPGEISRGLVVPPPPLVVPPEPADTPALDRQPVISIPVQTQPMPVARPRTVPSLPAPSATISSAPQPIVVQPPVSMEYVPDLTGPALVYDSGGASVRSGKEPSILASGQNPPSAAAGSGATSSEPVARLTRIANPTTVVPTGTLIRAVLETPIDTSRPGLARAIVSRDVRGFDGRRILIPRGSRLVGEYGADVRPGQNKVLVNWMQLIRSDGSVMRLESPAADAMGGAGVPGRVNSFFLERFANALMQTALTFGGNLAAWSSDAPVVVAVPTAGVNAAAAAGQAGLVGQTPQPKITVKQGTVFNVFVARDLDFARHPPAQ